MEFLKNPGFCKPCYRLNTVIDNALPTASTAQNIWPLWHRCDIATSVSASPAHPLCRCPFPCPCHCVAPTPVCALWSDTVSTADVNAPAHYLYNDDQSQLSTVQQQPITAHYLYNDDQSQFSTQHTRFLHHWSPHHSFGSSRTLK